MRTCASISSNRKSTLRGISIFLLILSMSSCKKGDTGPAGPAGTANVSYSDWFTPAAYKKDTVFGTYGFSYNKPIDALTQKMIDSGTVLVFGKLAGYNPVIWPTGQVSQMPITIAYMSGSVPNIDTWSALLSTGNLKIRLTSSTNQYGSIAVSHQFRYVIIPGGTKLPASMHVAPITGGQLNVLTTTDASSQNGRSDQAGYAEICQQLGIPH